MNKSQTNWAERNFTSQNKPLEMFVKFACVTTDFSVHGCLVCYLVRSVFSFGAELLIQCNIVCTNTSRTFFPLPVRESKNVFPRFT